ncbi:hypothetical protein QPL79_07045 [Ignisphaera sp. 4213-co]|uniref:Flagellin n=1 Tax=Ignisphaera cupida TaxID=3050454 RepID=A0ABD4Z896_9CREN|nr:hypothetical protein [Ignisphaera sp. 4213-co]MDK6029115.1 hypothetical protein [Ignisphaera sp. 4213-co]
MFSKGQGEYVSATIMILIMVMFTFLAFGWGTYIERIGRYMVNALESSKEALDISILYEGDGVKLVIKNKWDGTSIAKGILILFKNSEIIYLNVEDTVIPVGSLVTINISLPNFNWGNVDRICIYTNHLNIFCNSIEKLVLNVEGGYWYTISRQLLGESKSYVIIDLRTGSEIPVYIWDANKSYIIFYVGATNRTSIAFLESDKPLQVLETKTWFKPLILAPYIELAVNHAFSWTLNSLCGAGPVYGCGNTILYASTSIENEKYWFDGRAVHYELTVTYSFPKEVSFQYYAGGEVYGVSIQLHNYEEIALWQNWQAMIRIENVSISADAGIYNNMRLAGKQFTAFNNSCSLKENVVGAQFKYVSTQIQIITNTTANIIADLPKGFICAFEPFNIVEAKVKIELPMATTNIVKNYIKNFSNVITTLNGFMIRVIG